MAITAVIAISVFSTLAIIALLLLATKHILLHRHHQRWQTVTGAAHHNHGMRNKYHWHGQTRLGKHPLDWVENILQLDAEQLTFWNTLKQAIIESQQDLAAYGEVLAGAGNLEQTVNRWEDFIQDGLIELRKLKPKLIEFYQSLNEQQQQKINAWLAGKSVSKHSCGFHCRTM